MKRYGATKVIVTDRLASYRAAMKVLGNENKRETARWVNNRAENSHQPFRRRERAMLRFRQMRSLQKFASVHSSVHNHFNHQRNIERRSRFKDLRNAALVEWRGLLAAQYPSPKGNRRLVRIRLTAPALAFAQLLPISIHI